MTSIITPFLPDNLEALHTREESVKTENSLRVNANQALKEHIGLVHDCLDMINWMANKDLGSADKDQVIYGLGIRLFNSTACVLRLVLSGYYQGAVSFLRDLAEIGFLLDYFNYAPDSISVWKNSKDSKERQQFLPVAIRKMLDERDGYEEKKRASMYSLLSKYGTHATFEGFQLTIQNNLFVMGPFESEKMLTGIVEETCKILPYVVLIYITHWQELQLPDLEQKLHFLENVQIWWKKYMNESFDITSLEEAKKLMRAINAR